MSIIVAKKGQPKEIDKNPHLKKKKQTNPQLFFRVERIRSQIMKGVE